MFLMSTGPQLCPLLFVKQRLPDVPAVGKVLLRHDYSPKESDPTQSVLRGSTKVAIAVNTCALMVLKELNEEAEEAVRLRGARPWRPM